jgi:excinuclease ABC subunit C
MVEECQIIRQWLRQKSHGEKVEIIVPHAGQQQELVQMAAENAAATLAALKAQWEADTHRQEEALAELQNALALAGPPNRIECFDISNTQGTAAVGSMVVFEQGVPRKSHYRHFNIRTVRGPDDFASMEEVLNRRFNRWQAAQEALASPGKKPDASFTMLPDLLIVDGGKGQLGRAVTVLDRFGLLGKIPVAGLAKQNEELFVPGRPYPIILPRQSQGLYLININDGAHRLYLQAARKEGLARLDAFRHRPGKRKLLLNRSVRSGISGCLADELTAAGSLRCRGDKSYLEWRSGETSVERCG